MDFDYARQVGEVQMTPGGFLYGGHATFRSTSIQGVHRATFDENPTKLFNVGTRISTCYNFSISTLPSFFLPLIPFRTCPSFLLRYSESTYLSFLQKEKKKLGLSR